MNVQIMDTGGQERFRAVNNMYYKKANCCLLVYDITDKKSFEDCKNYYCQQIKENCVADVKVILLGNKTDLDSKRVISADEAGQFALKNGYIFMESSCLKNENVSNAFETLIEITNIESKKSNNENNKSNIKLDKIKGDKKEGKGCPC